MNAGRTAKKKQLMRSSWFKRLFLIGLCCFFSQACNLNHQETKKATQVETSVKIAKDSCDNWLADLLQDSLFSSTLPEFEYFPDHYIYFLKKIRTPKGFFGIIANPPFFLATYEGDTLGNWHRLNCDPVQGGIKYEPKWLDVNFDQHPDLVIDSPNGGVHGNHFVFVFTFDKNLQTYRRDTLFELENLSLDSKKELLRSQHYSSTCGTNIKQLYKLQNDSLVCLGEVSIQGCHGDSSMLWWKWLKNRTLRADSAFLESDKAWGKFTQMIWKTN